MWINKILSNNSHTNVMMGRENLIKIGIWIQNLSLYKPLGTKFISLIATLNNIAPHNFSSHIANIKLGKSSEI